MKSSITKRWVRGSLLFTLALVLVAEAVFLYFTISGYYDNVRRSMINQLNILSEQVRVSSSATTDEKSLRLIRAVENFDKKTQYELMLVRASGTIEMSSSGIARYYSETPQDIVEALQAGGNGTGEFIGTGQSGERIMAITMQVPTPARGVVAMRLVTSLTLVDRSVMNVVLMSLVVLGAVVMASVVSGVFFIRSIVYPLRKVEATATRIAEGDFETRIANSSADEIGSLCKTINHMAEELSRSERMKNEFISSVSHELRTPLTSIKGWTETVGRLDKDDPNFRRGIEIITGEADRLYDMVEELLDFSRMQDGLKLERELLDLAAEVEEAVLLSGARASGLGVALLYTAPELPVPVMADKNRLRQVMVNLLDNAIKYSYTGGDITVEILQDGASVFVVVTDEGQGISPEDLEYVTQRFYKGKGSMRGSGIGLAVVDEIVQAHGGELTITSEVNRGTQVTIRLDRHGMKQGASKQDDD